MSKSGRLGEGLPEGRGVRAFAMEGLHLFQALEQDRQELPTLAELTAGLAPGRTDPQQITYFHNVPGAGIQFAAVGAKVLRLAKEQGVGTEIPTDWFLQDMRAWLALRAAPGLPVVRGLRAVRGPSLRD